MQFGFATLLAGAEVNGVSADVALFDISALSLIPTLLSILIDVEDDDVVDTDVDVADESANVVEPVAEFAVGSSSTNKLHCCNVFSAGNTRPR